MKKKQPKKPKENSIKEVTTQNLHEMKEYFSTIGEGRAREIFDKIFTDSLIAGIPEALEKLRKEDPKSFIYYTTSILSQLNRRIVDERRDKKYDRQLNLEQKRFELQCKAYGVDSQPKDSISSFVEEVEQRLGDKALKKAGLKQDKE